VGQPGQIANLPLRAKRGNLVANALALMHSPRIPGNLPAGKGLVLPPAGVGEVFDIFITIIYLKIISLYNQQVSCRRNRIKINKTSG
jgi:hypothetical protein